MQKAQPTFEGRKEETTTPLNPATSAPGDLAAPVREGEDEAPVLDVPDTLDHEVTQEDLDNNPTLAEQGVKVGDTIQIPAPCETEKDSPSETSE